MTGISHLNILVQQGGSAQELQQIKQQSAEYTQTVAAQDQMARTAEARERVHKSGEPETSYLKRDKSGKKGGGQGSGEEQREKKKKEEKLPALTGNLLDTVA